MEPMAIGLGSLNSNSETHMTVVCDPRLIYGRGWISRVFICCAALSQDDILYSLIKVNVYYFVTHIIILSYMYPEVRGYK